MGLAAVKMINSNAREEMLSFDQLPESLRDMLREFPFSATQVLALHRSGFNTPGLVEHMKTEAAKQGMRPSPLFRRPILPPTDRVP